MDGISSFAVKSLLGGWVLREDDPHSLPPVDTWSLFETIDLPFSEIQRGSRAILHIPMKMLPWKTC
jgi:hypothetical protein